MKERMRESDSLSLASKWCWVHGIFSFLSLLVHLSVFFLFFVSLHLPPPLYLSLSRLFFLQPFLPQLVPPCFILCVSLVSLPHSFPSSKPPVQNIKAIKMLLSYFSLGQSGGPTEIPTLPSLTPCPLHGVSIIFYKTKS